MNQDGSIINKTFLLLNYVVNGNSCMYFELDKPIDVDLLQKALDALAHRHPLLNCRLSRTLFGYRWITIPQPGSIPLTCQTSDIADKQQTMDILTRNAWQLGFNVFRERQLRAYYLKTPSAYYVQLVPNHMLADARSSDLLMSELAKIYDHLSRGHSAAPVFSAPVLGSTDGNLELFARHLSLKKKVKLVFQALGHIVADIIRPKSGIAITARTNSEKRGETRVLSRDIGVENIEIIKHNLKRSGYTIHPLLVLSVLKAVRTYNERRGIKTDVVRVSDMFSLLPFSTTNLTNVYNCYVVPFTTYYDIKDSDLDTMSYIRDKIQYHKNGGILRELFRQGIYTFTGTFSPKKLATSLVTRLVVKNNIIISNPGVVKFNIPDLGNSRILSYTSFSQLFPPARIFFLFSTFRSTLHLNILYDANAFTEDEVENEIYHEFLRNMQSISANFRQQQNDQVQAHETIDCAS